MPELFDDNEDDLNEVDTFVNTDEEIDQEVREHMTLEVPRRREKDARQRLEDMLEDKRLRDELNDLVDY